MEIKTETCRACGGEAIAAFTGHLLGRPVDYFECGTCGYLQTQEPTWLAEAYASPINVTDTGILDRNTLNARRVAALCMLLGRTDARIVDFAGGHGILVRMLRDVGLQASWSDKYCENLFARGFEHDGGAADMATAFEAFEHFVDLGLELDRMLAVAPLVVFSTQLAPDPAPQPSTWWYYGEEHGQHIGFLRKRTLDLLAERRNARAFTNGNDLHVILRGETKIDFRRWGWAMRIWPLYRKFFPRSLTAADSEALKKIPG